MAARTRTPATPLPNALGVAPAAGISAEALVRSIDAASDDLDALTRDQAADEAPGVAQVRQSFQVIFLLYALVVPFVTGLFFLIITVQKAGALTLLRAIGAPGRRLVAALLVQVALIVGARPARRHRPLRAAHDRLGDAARAALRDDAPSSVWSVVLLVLGLLSSLLAARRVLAIDPVDGDHRRGSAMRLALRELRRRPGRFVTATFILTLVAVLVMFLGGLLDGLIRSSTDAVRAQDGDLIVFSSTAQSSFLRSRIDADTRATVDGGPRRRRDAAASASSSSAPASRATDRETSRDVALFGYELAPVGVPDPPAPGEVYADDVLRADGVEVGMEILLGPARSPVTVIGFVSDTTLLGAGIAVGRPGDVARGAVGEPPRRAAGRRRLPGPRRAHHRRRRRRRGRRGDRCRHRRRDRVAHHHRGRRRHPGGVEQQRSTFNQIIGVTIAIAVVVVALFFALLTVERLGLYGVLKAIGARSRTLVRRPRRSKRSS